MKKKYSTEASIKQVTLENDCLKLRLLPQVGGKMVDLISKKTQTQFLLKPDSGSTGLKPSFGEEFDLKYAYGFDECLPTVAPDRYQLNDNEIDLPDHGEVWSRSWEYQVLSDSSVELSIKGAGLGYVFTKRIELVDNEIAITYHLQNRSTEGFHYVWSSHPLLEVQEGDQIIMGQEVKKMNVYWSSDSVLQDRSRISWPISQKQDKAVDYSKVPGQGSNIAVKLFTSRLSVPCAVLYRSHSDESLVFSYDSLTDPYLGLWLCYNGWPEHSDQKSFTVALEPCNSPSDLLSEAVKLGKAPLINAGKSHNWSLSIRCVEGMEKIS